MSSAGEKQTVSGVALVILDGWGLAEAGPGNAVSLAKTPVFDRLCGEYSNGVTTLNASGLSVGLPEGQMGNSEVGHLNLGAGAIVPQDLVRINDAVDHGELASIQAITDAFTASENVHLIGLVSDGGVHSSIDHLKALIDLAGRMRTDRLFIHVFTDGRDTSPTSAIDFVEQIERHCYEVGVGRVGSVIGRYFAMDRDRRWDRTQVAYDLLVHGHGEFEAETGLAAVKQAYERGETDEFISATAVAGGAPIAPGDSVFAFNFRPDRMRQLVYALADPEAPEIERDYSPPVEHLATLTEYEEGQPQPIAFPPLRPQVTLAEVIAQLGLAQLHVAETEKYPHVTYFFNGGEETPFAAEERQMVQSPREVATYDLKPEMSAAGVADAFISNWTKLRPAFGVVNFANPDMVGHTGSIPAAVAAIETVDRLLAEVVAAVESTGGVCIITADHGNAEYMLEPNGSPNTAHTTNPVPVVVTSHEVKLRSDRGKLADVAPTVLELLNIEQPTAMTGESLLKSHRRPNRE